MLREYKNIRQISGDSTRRWFYDDFFDLFVWTDDAGQMTGFQLCSDRHGTPRVLTSLDNTTLSHNLIDSGDTKSGKIKATPVPGAVVPFDKFGVVDRFQNQSAGVPSEYVQRIMDVLNRA